MNRAKSERPPWKTVIYDGPCKHKEKPPKDKKEHIYGTAYCPACTASRGVDGKWRVILDG